jgi:hypothetical protein
LLLGDRNRAEIELSVLSRQRVDARLATAAALPSELKAWENDRNTNHCIVRGRFTTADAQIRLRRL